jgi:hypothetical protein
MTKKSTSAKPKAKQSKKTTPPPVVEAGVVVDDEGVQETAAAATPVSTTASRRAARLNRQQVKALSLEEEYAYVVKDLRRVFILAGIMFAGLILVNLAFSLLGG